nr:hypothetical protein [Planococcus salinarum]
MQDDSVTDIRKNTNAYLQEENAAAVSSPAIPLSCFLNRSDSKKSIRKGHQTMPFILQPF